MTTTVQLCRLRCVQALTLCSFVSFSWAQEAARVREPVDDPVAAREELVGDRLLRLEDRMFRLSEKLREERPEQAERLVRGIQAARDRLIRNRVEEATEALRQGNMARALELQEGIVADLDALLRILTSDELDPAARKAHIARLEETLEALDGLIEDQVAARDEAEARNPDNQERGAGSREEESSASADPLAEQAERQEELAERAEDLAQRMAGRESESEEARSGEKDESAREAPIDGADSVARAEGEMGEAAGELGARRPSEAVPRQNKALRELRQARREVEEELEQERQEQREEKLKGLEERFREMLAGQMEITRTTAGLSKLSEDEWTRAATLKTAELAGGERELAEEAALAVHILRDDGSTVVFPSIAESVQADMVRAARRLDERRVASATGALQEDIETALRDLISAVGRERRENQRRQRGPSRMADGATPLLPGSAELKLLRSMQERVTERTRRAGTDENPDSRTEAHRLAERQRRISRLAGEMEERASLP